MILEVVLSDAIVLFNSGLLLFLLVIISLVGSLGVGVTSGSLI